MVFLIKLRPTQNGQTMSQSTTTSGVHIVLLLALCGTLYFPYLGSTPFFDKGEPREALAVRDIMERGEWLVPLKRTTDIPSKPPLFHWSAALTSRVIGELNEATIRFPSALYATLGVLLVYVFGRRRFGAQIGLLGAAILATTLVYENQALSARVDMTLCFFVTLNLVLFYSLYSGLLTRQLWYYAFYALMGIGTLAKGPLGILLPGLVIGAFLVLKRRWDLISKFSFHPGVALTILLTVIWYGIAVTRGGEGFFQRQILQENLARFVGGSGHNHPVYYYIPYLFSLGLPWSLFLPFLIWDLFREGDFSQDDRLFLKLWFFIIFVFFSLSLGKRPVYLLPVYPALSLLLAAWVFDKDAPVGKRRFIYWFIAMIGGFVGLVLLIIALGGVWQHDTGWFFSAIEGFLKPKDRANLLLVKDSLQTFGPSFRFACLVSGILWLAAAYSLWMGRLRSVPQWFVLISILSTFIGRGMVIPVIAEAKSYRSFMDQVNEQVTPNNKLFLYGAFNSDPVFFYRRGPIETLNRRVELMADKIVDVNGYVMMPQQTWVKIQINSRALPLPLLTSTGTGPEGDTPLVLTRGSDFTESNRAKPVRDPVER
jgi:4-amino-4-deoxy-L-arabinose transferase-like glycosyltransferase